MGDLMEFTPKQKKRIADFLGLTVPEANLQLHALQRYATEYYEAELGPMPPRQIANIVVRMKEHADGLAIAFDELAVQLRDAPTDWLQDPLNRCRLRAQEIIAALPSRFPRNQPDWQARMLVYDLLTVWHWSYGKIPSKGPKAPFTLFVRAMFEMLEGRQGNKPPRDARTLVDAAIEKWRRYHETPRPPAEKLIMGTPEFDDFMAHQDAERFFGAITYLIYGQL